MSEVRSPVSTSPVNLPSPLVIVTLIADLVLLTSAWHAQTDFNPFGAVLTGLSVLLFFGLVFLISLIAPFVFRKAPLRERTLPLVLNCSTVVLLLLVPWYKVVRWVDFNLNLNQRMEVVSMVHSGKLKPDLSGDRVHNMIVLPPSLKHVSKMGKVMLPYPMAGSRPDYSDKSDLSEIDMLFYTGTGMLEHYSGFLYCTDGQHAEFFEPDDGVIVEQYRDHWYWISN